MVRHLCYSIIAEVMRIAAKNPRVNVVLEDDMYQMIRHLAKRDKTTLSKKIKEFVENSLEELEDRHLSKIADERFKTFSKKSALLHRDIFK